MRPFGRSWLLRCILRLNMLICLMMVMVELVGTLRFRIRITIRSRLLRHFRFVLLWRIRMFIIKYLRRWRISRIVVNLCLLRILLLDLLNKFRTSRPMNLALRLTSLIKAGHLAYSPKRGTFHCVTLLWRLTVRPRKSRLICLNLRCRMKRFTILDRLNRV